MDLITAILAEQNSKKPASEKLLWFVRLLKWIQGPKTNDEVQQNWDKVYTVRLKFILYQLKNNPAWAEEFSKTISPVLLELTQPMQLAYSGMSAETSFTQDLLFRIQEKILPQTPIANDMSSIVLEVFNSEAESLLIDSIDESILSELIILIAQNSKFKEELKIRISEAIQILGLHISQEEILIRKRLSLNSESIASYSELALARYLFKSKDALDDRDLPQLEQMVSAIEMQNKHLFEKLSSQGVQIETVYLFQSQNQKLRRLRLMLNFLNPSISTATSTRLFISNLIQDVHEGRGLLAFLSQSFSLIGQRIVQANSHVGEHYIARSWDGFKKMLFSSMGGGLITSVTVFLKFFVSFLNLTGFAKGLAESLNYSGSFLVIQSFGYTLATKQPSTTALFLTKTIEESVKNGGRTFIDLLRTQIVAVIGNLSTAFPVCFIVSWVSVLIGYPILSQTSAQYIFNSSQLLGPSVIYACFTGVLLFFSSLVAGWFENFCHVTQLPRRIQYNKRLNFIWGRVRAEKLADYLEKNSNLLAANISLGLFLGMIPAILKFMNIPLDVRHVTLATGGFAASLPVVLQQGIPAVELFNSVSGLVLIGIGNLTVSFSLAILLSTASAPTVRSRIIKVLRISFSRLIRRPWLLVIPNKNI